MNQPAENVADALRAGQRMLADAGVPDPARDARYLLAHALGVAPDRVTLLLPDAFPQAAQNAWRAALEARAARQPVAQITGERLFWGRTFRVTRDTLDPRPETEILIAQALAEPFSTVLDLGTGTGAILLSLLAENPSAMGLGTDLSPAALEVARDNASRLGITTADFRESDWFSKISGRHDVIVSNPPYIASGEMAMLAPEVRDWEPVLALTDGGDGLSAYRAIAAGADAHLAPQGRLIVEIGANQGQAVADLFVGAGLREVTIHRDFDGRDRVVAARAGQKPR